MNLHDGEKKGNRQGLDDFGCQGQGLHWLELGQNYIRQLEVLYIDASSASR
jgi:hypothetical protein